MRKLLSLLVLVVLSLLLFVVVFSAVHRPLTIGGLAQDVQLRSAYAQGLSSPKLVVWAGSNGRYSHRCETLSARLQLPCANLSLAMGVGLDFQIMQFEPLLKAGDLVYMPLEYEQYRLGRVEMEGGAENPALVHDMRERLWSLPPRRIAAAYGYFDLSYLVHGLAEMSLARAGVRPRSGSLEVRTVQGDVAGHGADAGAAYAGFVARMRFDAKPLPQDSHAMQVLAGFLARARVRGVTVVGGLPTVPEHVALDAGSLKTLQILFERHGHRLLVLPNRSQYPIDCFYDTLYHLNEACQIRHSEAVAAALALPGLLPRSGGLL